jgi:tripartite-type tricarboxylate transporter receptor subunit TctC
LPGYEVDAWFAVFAPTGTPQLAVDHLSNEVARVVGSPEFKQKSEEQDAFALVIDPKALDAHVQRELERWGKVIKTANTTAE